MSGHADAKINSITVNLQTATDIDLVVNYAYMSGNNDVVTTADKTVSLF